MLSRGSGNYLYCPAAELRTLSVVSDGLCPADRVELSGDRIVDGDDLRQQIPDFAFADFAKTGTCFPDSRDAFGEIFAERLIAAQFIEASRAKLLRALTKGLLTRHSILHSGEKDLPSVI